MRATPMLRDLQRDMQQYLLGETSGVTSAIVDAPPLPAQDRLAIYRNAYQVRLIDALHETYPVLHGLLGDIESDVKKLRVVGCGLWVGRGTA